jgi:hypothetical protein
MGEKADATIRSASRAAYDLSVFDLGRIEVAVVIPFAPTTAAAMSLMMIPTTLSTSCAMTSTRFLTFGSSLVGTGMRRVTRTFAVLEVSRPLLRAVRDPAIDVFTARAFEPVDAFLEEVAELLYELSSISHVRTSARATRAPPSFRPGPRVAVTGLSEELMHEPSPDDPIVHCRGVEQAPCPRLTRL